MKHFSIKTLTFGVAMMVAAPVFAHEGEVISNPDTAYSHILMQPVWTQVATVEGVCSTDITPALATALAVPGRDSNASTVAFTHLACFAK